MEGCTREGSQPCMWKRKLQMRAIIRVALCAVSGVVKAHPLVGPGGQGQGSGLTTVQQAVAHQGRQPAGSALGPTTRAVPRC